MPFEEDLSITLAGSHKRPERDASITHYKLKVRAEASAGSVQREVVRRFPNILYEASALPAANSWARMQGPSTAKALQST